jgi:drug/metabolite transporter (DMT)-like permease
LSTARLSPRLVLLMTAAPLLWSGNAIAGRLAVGTVPPLLLNCLRWAVALVLLLPLARSVFRSPGEVVRRWRYLAVLGLFSVAMFNALQYLALVSSTPINVTLIASSLPLWVLAVGALFFGERVAARQGLGAVLSLAGVLCVIARGDPTALAEVRFVRGDLYVVLSVLAWAFYTWLLVRPPAHMQPPQRPDWDWATFLALQVAFGLVGAAAAAGAEALLTDAPVQWNARLLVLLAYVAIGPSILAFRCWGLGVAEGGPALAAFFNNLTPLFTALLSAAVLGEPPRGYHALAFALIVGGIAVSAGAAKSRR